MTVSGETIQLVAAASPALAEAHWNRLLASHPELDLIVSGTRDAVAMIEGFAREMPENDMFEAIMFGHAAIKEIIDLQREFAQKIGVNG